MTLRTVLTWTAPVVSSEGDQIVANSVDEDYSIRFRTEDERTDAMSAIERSRWYHGCEGIAQEDKLDAADRDVTRVTRSDPENTRPSSENSEHDSAGTGDELPGTNDHDTLQDVSNNTINLAAWTGGATKKVRWKASEKQKRKAKKARQAAESKGAVQVAAPRTTSTTSNRAQTVNASTGSTPSCGLSANPEDSRTPPLPKRLPTNAFVTPDLDTRGQWLDVIKEQLMTLFGPADLSKVTNLSEPMKLQPLYDLPKDEQERTVELGHAHAGMLYLDCGFATTDKWGVDEGDDDGCYLYYVTTPFGKRLYKLRPFFLLRIDSLDIYGVFAYRHGGKSLHDLSPAIRAKRLRLVNTEDYNSYSTPPANAVLTSGYRAEPNSYVSTNMITISLTAPMSLMRGCLANQGKIALAQATLTMHFRHMNQLCMPKGAPTADASNQISAQRSMPGIQTLQQGYGNQGHAPQPAPKAQQARNARLGRAESKEGFIERLIEAVDWETAFDSIEQQLKEQENYAKELQARVDEAISRLGILQDRRSGVPDLGYAIDEDKGAIADLRVQILERTKIRLHTSEMLLKAKPAKMALLHSLYRRVTWFVDVTQGDEEVSGLPIDN
ncbi:hypothetical protein LTR37_008118 [Vermiconidia calcicola]|uniref:Uncharacterized protein n=1 Tax=Vermiconidia calcicola TaxID=1690605 RepID=A0ACC3NBT5_9PEZI|nr:hypothetical protein LTR37_008118 [Vermiconidia calcicola]